MFRITKFEALAIQAAQLEHYERQYPGITDRLRAATRALLGIADQGGD